MTFSYGRPKDLNFVSFFPSASLIDANIYMLFVLQKIGGKKTAIQHAYFIWNIIYILLKSVNSVFWLFSFIWLWLFNTVFIDLVLMLIYGMGYFPLFAGITACSCMEYLRSTRFSLVFTAEVFANAFCKQRIAVNTFNYSRKNIFIYEKKFWRTKSNIFLR